MSSLNPAPTPKAFAFGEPTLPRRPLAEVDRAHSRLLDAAHAESKRTVAALFWSAVGAGLGISFSFLAAAGASAIVPAAWSSVAVALAYPLGFAIVVLGGYQLFTENTLPPVALTLERIMTVPSLLRIWGIVLVGNLFGACVIGTALAIDGLLPQQVIEAAVAMAGHPVPPLGAVFGRAILAGWLVATLVWLIHRTKGRGALAITWVLVAMMPVLHLEHIVVGTVEGVFALHLGLTGLAPLLGRLALVLVGNTVGGVVLVALLNHGRTRNLQHRLPWRVWILGEGSIRDVVVAVEGRRHWWLASRTRKVPSALYDSAAEVITAAEALGAGELVIHRADGTKRQVTLDRQARCR